MDSDSSSMMNDDFIFDFCDSSDYVLSVSERSSPMKSFLSDSESWPISVDVHEKNSPLQKALAKKNIYEIESLLRSSTTDIEVVDNFGNTPLMEALLRRFYSVIDLLLKKEVNVNAKNCNHRTPLHFAVLGGNAKYITILIEKGANINSKDGKGKTPLSKAVEIKSESAVKLLLAKGCNVNVLDKYGNSPLHSALKRHFWKIAELLIANGCNVAQQNQRGETPLHIAARKEKSDDKTILDRESSINAWDDVDTSPSMEASVNDLVSICKLLLANDGDQSSKIVNMKNNRGQTALHIAAESYRRIDFSNNEEMQFYAAIQQEYIEFCNILLSKGSSINDKDNDGNSPIHTAVVAENTALLKTILDNGADVDCANKYGETALQIVLGHDKNFEEKCRMLVGYGANINVFDLYNKTPLHAAVTSEEGNFWQFLLDNGADVYARDTYGNSPLHLVAESGSSRYFHLILCSYPNVNHKNNDGKTALHMSATSLKDAKQKCELIIGAGADVTIKDNFSRTPLHFAALNSLCSVCEMLIAKGVIVGAIDYYGKAPIHYAVKTKQLESLKFILEHGANGNQNNWYDKTIVPHATGIFKESKSMCKLLLDRGANVTASDNDYQTPLHLATECLSLPVVRLLLEAGAEVNAQDRKGKTPLHMLDNRISDMSSIELLTYKYDPTGIVKYMLEWGALSTLKDKSGNTALSYILSKLPELYWRGMPGVIKSHIVKCKSAKLFTDVEYKLLSDTADKNNFEISCSRELAAMRGAMIGKHSLLDVFSQYSDPTYLSNCELKAALGSNMMLQFPIYRSLLKSTFIRANMRVKLIFRAQNVLKMPLPNEMNSKILSYLSDHELDHVIKAKGSLINNDIYEDK